MFRQGWRGRKIRKRTLRFKFRPRNLRTCPHPCAEPKDTIEHTAVSCTIGILKGSALKRHLEDGMGIALPCAIPNSGFASETGLYKAFSGIRAGIVKQPLFLRKSARGGV